MAAIHSIVYKPKQQPDLDDQYLRVAAQEVMLIADYGIDADRKGGHPKRQLNIMDYETAQELGGVGYKVQPGELGEQIMVRGLRLSQLEPGARLRLGDSAVVEVTEFRNGCDRFDHIHGQRPQKGARVLGVMARVVTDGAIRLGDPVALVVAE